MRHFDQFNILTDKQHGFRKRRSTATQIIVTIQGITSKLRSGKDQADAILLDFAKAFDKVHHQRFLYELSFYGIRGDTLKWIIAFLGHRKQQVLLDGSICHLWNATGNSSGPLLFLAIINNLPESVKASNPRLFADDCLLNKLINCDADAESVQQDLLALEEWERKWQMKFHLENVRSFTSAPTNDTRDTPYTGSMVTPLNLLTAESTLSCTGAILKNRPVC